ncbi:hypothetical protein [Ferruginibacter albus]|uniref:hypothetical protein n=1 Tax=Ferruginibacter albus TaxID=2875540 RepID=UPI001CC41397|nr:hypothetical protein [Ferruginibacter albus]UAY52883.1 hypothetical protein K9M53_04190 [Ferruginibacter albus]
MKSILFSIIIVSVLLTSCSKSNPVNTGGGGTSSTLSADIDGKPTDFSIYAVATHQNTSGSYSIGIAGYNGSVSGSLISFGVGGSTPVVAGTFDNSYSAATYKTSMSLFEQPGNIIYLSNGISPNIGTVTISSINAESVSGTFSGGIIHSGDNATHTITNGKFNVKFSN